jgi:hypothetical protein
LVLQSLERGFSRLPLSPFLFLIIVEAINRLLKEARTNGLLRGIRVTELEMVSHLLFVYDVLCSVYGSNRDLTMLKRILDLYCRAIGMMINLEKS